MAPLGHRRARGPLPDDALARLRADPRYAALRGGGLPSVESLADMIARVAPYWADVLAGQLCSGRRVLVVAHGNALRARGGGYLDPDSARTAAATVAAEGQA